MWFIEKRFLSKSSFLGGTALRIFYGLDRFSEGLDFSLITKDVNFDLSEYFPFIENELKSVGLNFVVQEKDKTIDSNIKSAFLKGNTREHILLVYEDEKLANTINSNEVIKANLK